MLFCRKCHDLAKYQSTCDSLGLILFPSNGNSWMHVTYRNTVKDEYKYVTVSENLNYKPIVSQSAGTI